MPFAANFPGYGTYPIYEMKGKVRVPLLTSMQYKDYIWPHNPAIYNIEFSKRYIKHGYVDINNEEIEDLGLEARVMSGSGAFFGFYAYDEFKKLASVFYDKGVGTLKHPVWQEAQALFTKLSLKQEPLPDYVEYEFEFVEHVDINIIEEVTNTTVNDPSNPNPNPVPSSTSSAPFILHIVKQGETLSGIGATYGVPWRQIANDNKSLITDPNVIQIGWQLKINNPKKEPKIVAPRRNTDYDPAYERFMNTFGHKYSTEPQGE